MRKWLSGRRLLAAIAVVLVAAGLLVWRQTSNAPSYKTDSFTFDSDAVSPVALDVTVYVPNSAGSDSRVPAVILAHGFGGSKESVSQDAIDLVNRGYVVLTYSARGFGKSTGQINLNAPDAEVADARNLVTYLASRDDVLLDGDGDPRVGITGGSYGGALALLTAAYDERVDAIVPMITWNRLSRVFFPNGAGAPQSIAGPAEVGGTDAPVGTFKREWAGAFFGLGKGVDLTSVLSAGLGSGGTSGSGGGTDSADDGEVDGSSDSPSMPDVESTTTTAGAADLVCGKFAADICQVYAQAAESGTLDAAGIARLDASSPYSVADKIKAPTMLVQGQADSLFPLSEADVTAGQLRNAGTPLKMVWTAGGHDSGGVASSDAELARLRQLTADWFGYYLAGEGKEPARDFELAQRTGLTTRAGSGRPTARTEVAASYPQTGEAKQIALVGPPQPVVRPPGSTPGSLSSLPGLGAIGIAFDPPGQAAYFSSEPLTSPVTIVGSPKMSLTIDGMPDGGVVFAKVYDSSGSGLPALPGGQVMPVTVPPNAGSTTLEVTLPAIAHRFETGHRVLVAIASTDRGYATSPQSQAFSVSVAGDGNLSYSSVKTESLSLAQSEWTKVIIGLGAAAILGLIGWVIARVRRRKADLVDHDEALDDVPLVVSGLRKAYKDGFVAVRDVSFRVDRGQVVGLLGPNGAGKTTTLRMLMGLIYPSDGQLRVFGHRVRPGAPALSRLGCFVEGVGLMPHLSGRDNLHLYWAATGRPVEDARFEEVLTIAGLGTAIERKVSTYSQGMRQRVAIAQAMLGLPDLLVLDEPTNGLDPPQIAEMRQVLQSYAVDGRSVLVSSHQLAEVEQTCSHVVVINTGEVIASGTVAEVVGAGGEIDIDVDDAGRAADVLATLAGVRVIGRSGHRVMVELDGASASDAIAALVSADVRVEQAVPRRHLEDAFLALVGGGA